MSGDFFLDWSITSVSLFNAILLLWLGLTVLLNAERRTWGIWLAGTGLLMGSLFFFSHSAILGHGMEYLGQGIDFWWRTGWTMVIVLPFTWYLIMLWYAGFLDKAPSVPEQAPHAGRLWIVPPALLAAGLLLLLVLAHSLPSFEQINSIEVPNVSELGNVPWMAVAYPVYIFLCIGFSLYVLLRPRPSGRTMGDIARRRARPWLVWTTLTLLAVSVIVTSVMVWTLMNIGMRTIYRFYHAATVTLAWYDLIISALIAAATILLGQAIVAYEIFTGKILARRGFRRYWHRAILLGAGYGALVGWALTLQLRPIYSFLLAAVLIVLFYGLLTWRSFSERERTIDRLRPFVTSQKMHAHLLSNSGAGPLGVDVSTPFRSLCTEILGVSRACLAAAGSTAPLFGPPVTFPENTEESWPEISEVVRRFDSPRHMCIPLSLPGSDAETWAVSLWSERGLVGVLLLGEKLGNGLYTQEEIEIARAIGERLIDTQISAEAAHRLMALQRRQLAEAQVIDRQTRLALHDDVLPQMHAAMLNLGQAPDASQPAVSQTIASLADLHRTVSGMLRGIPAASAVNVEERGLMGALRQSVEGELGSAFDEVSWSIEVGVEQRLAQIPVVTAEVIFYAAREAIRNAARHARHRHEGKDLALSITAKWEDGFSLQIEDNGIGLSAEDIHEDGGHGLALHSTMLAIVGGSMTIESERESYTRVILNLAESRYPR